MEVFLSVVMTLAVLGGLLWAVKSLLTTKRGKPMVCGNCGHHGRPVAATRGSILIEVVGWLAFLIPGLIYSLWRLSTRHMACESCGSTALMPADSPVGRRMLKEQRQEPAGAAAPRSRL